MTEAAMLAAKTGGPPDPAALLEAERKGWDAASRQVDEAIRSTRRAAVDAVLGLVRPACEQLISRVEEVKSAADKVPSLDFRKAPLVPTAALSAPKPQPERQRVTQPRSNGHLPPGERAVLIAAEQFNGVTREQLTILTGYKRSSRDAYIQRLREKNYVEVDGQMVRTTEAGAAALPSDYAPLPIGADLRAYWLNRLPEGERRILEVLIERHPASVPRTEIDEITGYKRSSRDAYLQRMKAKRLWQSDGSAVRASEALF